ncbi:proton/sodium-glutamate symport protein [Waddlia chondrophila 2032/99]|uniref:Proton/sodium-glutamate symport protein n=2 Tax=Waddlia chondrophila TaxID=71667 RepID=F8LFB6_9BACT|nr:dicarboxylate/amino acid:cation symporter [Waddlia chondrophila]ADI39072.1 putative proton/sodium-glutamate symporter [Waddlia chondrophila WSU 86-1044]CCB92184.1 proton/sodium-glutamate symport protein [Waddlia chondrophila 2032/99]
MKLWVKILIALALGIVTGLIFGEQAVILKPLGTMFLSLINMIIVLLVLASMTCGITSIHDPQKLGRVGLKSVVLYLSTTAVAILIGLLFAQLFHPGATLTMARTSEVVVSKAPSLGSIILSVIPENPVRSLAEGNVLQIIVFAIFLGISINFAGPKGRPVLEFLESLADVMYRLTSIVMEFSPIGVFAIMASTTGVSGAQVLLPLLKFLLTFYSACLVHTIVVFCGLLWFLAKLSPWPFFRGMGDALMVAFSTSSSSAALPVTMHCAQENLGVSKNISSFVLPLGSTVNMNGAAIFQGMAVMFIAQAYGIELGWQSLLTIVVTATLSAVGAAGIPGSGFIMLSVVFSSVGLPIEGLALLAGIDRIREMGSTVMNVMGDAVVAVYVAKVEGELDERQYYHEELVELEGSDI